MGGFEIIFKDFLYYVYIYGYNASTKWEKFTDSAAIDRFFLYNDLFGCFI